MHGASDRCHRPIDGYMMYKDNDFENYSHFSAKFNLTLNKPIILTHARKSDQY